MNMLRVMYAVNVFLVMVIAIFCVKYDIFRKLIVRITYGRGGVL